MDELVDKVNAVVIQGASLIMRPELSEHIHAPHFNYGFICLDKNGNIKWEEDIINTVVTVGRNDLLDKYFKGSAYTAAWKLGLKGAGAVAAGDTLSSHAGWAEVNPYAGNRPAIVFGTSASGSNTASVIAYTINGSATVAGGFITDQVSGTAGILYSAGDFATSRSVVSGDTLNVTLTVSV